MAKTEPRYCSNCGKGFDARIKDLRQGGAKYCSRVCSGMERAKKATREASPSLKSILKAAPAPLRMIPEKLTSNRGGS